MKPASPAALAIMSGGKYMCAGMYDITLQNGSVAHYTDFDVPFAASVFGVNVVNTYLTGLTMSRGAITTEVGLSSQEMELTISPQPDNPAGVITFQGYPLAQACRIGLLDNATVLYSKLFMNVPAPGALIDTSPQGIAWYAGTVGDIEPAGRLSVLLKIGNGGQYLTGQMPRNTFQPACSHTLYDPGCTLSQAAFTLSGTVITSINNGNFNTSLGQAAGYFDQGVIKWTSGNNQGFSGTVRQYGPFNGNVQVVLAFPFPVSVGDTFTIFPGCDHTQSTCKNKFNNIPHFKGYPYVPVTETLYDGGTSNPPNPVAPAVQAGSIVGSYPSGRILKQ